MEVFTSVSDAYRAENAASLIKAVKPVCTMPAEREIERDSVGFAFASNEILQKGEVGA